MTDKLRPEQEVRRLAEETGIWPNGWGPHHRHFAGDAIHRDGGPECPVPVDSSGNTPSLRRVWVFDTYALDAHEKHIIERTIAETTAKLRKKLGLT